SRLAQGLVPNGRTGMRAPAGSNIYQMRYSTNLENDAQKFADNCTTTGSPETLRPGQGENFARISQNSAMSAQAAVRQAIQQFWHEIYMDGINRKMIFTYNLLGKGTLVRFTQ
ncbi:hypothetical protein TELCIR_20499, partial [Teladorsagia circumcincta]